MNLLEFRKFFRTQSGRYDLVNEDGSDNGADVFINAGQKYLDRLADLPSNVGRVFKDVSAGDMMVTFEGVRAIHEVWCIGPDSKGDVHRLPLTKYSQKELRGVDRLTLESNYTAMFGDIDPDRPTYYAPAQLRLVTDSDGSSGGIGGMMDVLADGHQSYNGIVFMPPSDGNYSIEVVGDFYSKTLSADDDRTFWTVQHPIVLYMATMRQLEIIHRNSEGVKDWNNAIMAEVTTLDMDGVAENSTDVTQMEG